MGMGDNAGDAVRGGGGMSLSTGATGATGKTGIELSTGMGSGLINGLDGTTGGFTGRNDEPLLESVQAGDKTL